MSTLPRPKLISTFEDLEAALNAAGCQPVAGMALCPGHLEHTPSFSYAKGDRGQKFVFKCWSTAEGLDGCSFAEIMSILESGEVVYLSDWKKTFKGGSSNGSNGGVVTERYVYTDEDGNPLYSKVRWEPKRFTQEHYTAGGWVPGLNGSQRVPYRLQELVATPFDTTIFVVEGEKDAETLRNEGFLAVTTGGAGSWDPECNHWFEGRTIAVLPDMDAKGISYALTVVENLSPVATTVEVYVLPDLPLKGDVTDWINAGNKIGDGDLVASSVEELKELMTELHDEGQGVLRMEAAAMAKQAEAIFKPKPAKPEPKDKPFPASDEWTNEFPRGIYPKMVEDILDEMAADIGCPSVYLYSGLLPVLGIALGSDVRLQVNGSWWEPPCFWVANIGESGVKKNPPQRAIANPIYNIDEMLGDRYRADYEAYMDQPDPAAGQERLPKPVHKHIFTSEPTIEALRNTLITNHEGLIYINGEMTAWIRGMGAYKNGGGKSADRPIWLEIYSCSPIKPLRVKDPTVNYVIPYPFVNVLGGIQPAVVSELMGGGDGLQARLLYTVGERTPDSPIPPENKSIKINKQQPGSRIDRPGEPTKYYNKSIYPLWDNLVWEIYLSRPTHGDHRVLQLTKAARDYFYKWKSDLINPVLEAEDGKHDQEWVECLAKTAGHACRISIILATLYHEDGDGVNRTAVEVTLDHMKKACRAAEWFLGSAERALGLVDHSSTEQRAYAAQLNELKKWIASHPDKCTTRDMLRCGKTFMRNSKWLKQALIDIQYGEE